TFDLKFDLSSATTRNAFVPRLWASRKIARLIEEITKAGADSSANNGGPRSPSMVLTNSADPKMKELVDEIIRLSTEYGILTEYTSFLATEGTDFSSSDTLRLQAGQSLLSSAQQTRSGMGGVTQAMNNSAQRAQTSSNRTNFF